jgi:hypothetical protein
MLYLLIINISRFARNDKKGNYDLRENSKLSLMESEKRYVFLH